MSHTGIVVAAFFRRALYESTSALMPAVVTLASFSLGLLSQAFLGRLVDAAPNGQLGDYAGHYAGFLLLGMALLDLQNTVVAGLSRRIRDAQLSGSLEALLATPTRAPLLLFGLALPDVIASLVRLLLYAAVGTIFFGLRLSNASLPGVLLALALTLAAFAALALAGAALTMALRRADPLTIFVAATAVVAGGVFYPRAILPRWLELVGDALPISPALEALRAAVVHGRGPTELGAPLAHLAALVGLLLPASAWLFSRALGRARASGSLTSY